MAPVARETTEETGDLKYQKVFPIAHGGIGMVDLVLKREGSFERIYARKTLRPHLREDESFRQMFLQEARIAGLIRHSNVVSVIDVGEGPEGPYLVMTYVEGMTLSSLIRGLDKGEMLPVQVCLRIMDQVARGLHAVHELRDHDGTRLELVHRDISPQNVLIGFDGVVQVTDFGIAKALDREQHTTTGILKGKLGYMAPEQLRFEQPDQRTDLYALGVVLFELLTARRLFPGGVGSDSPQMILHGPVPDIQSARRDVPDSLVALLFDLLAKKREHRPPSARDVAERLSATLDELGEAPIQLETFLEERFDGLQAQMRGRVNAAIDEARSQSDLQIVRARQDAVVAGADVPEPPKRRLRLMVASALIALGVAWTGGMLWRENSARDEARAASVPERNPNATLSPPVTPLIQTNVELPPQGQDVVEENVAEEVAETSAVSVEQPEPIVDPARTRSSMRTQQREPRMRPTSMQAPEECPPGWWCPE